MKRLLPVLLPVLPLAVLAAMLMRRGLENIGILAGAVFAVSILVMLRRPTIALLGFVFLLYSNIPVVAYQDHGVPFFISASYIGLLFIPLAHTLVIERKPIRVDATLGLLLAFFAAMIASSFRAQELPINRLMTFLSEGLMLYWLLLNVVRDVPTLKRVMGITLLAAAMLGSLSGLQAVTKDYNQQFAGLAQRSLKLVEKENRRKLTAEGPKMYTSDRAEGSIGSPNRYAQTMIVLLPLSFALFRNGRTPRARAWWVLMGSLVMLGMLLSYSRGAYLGMLAMVLCATAVGWLRPKYVLIGGVALVMLAPIIAPTQVQRFLSLSQTTAIVARGTGQKVGDGSLRGRLTEMLAALNVYLDHPVLGVGPSQYSKFYSVEYQQDPSVSFREIRETRRAHSLYVEMAAELGTVGLLVFMSLIGWLLRELWRQRVAWMYAKPEWSDLATALVLGLVAYMTTAVFLHLSYERYLWFYVALCGVAITIMKSSTPPDPVSLARAEGVPFADYVEPIAVVSRNTMPPGAWGLR